MCRSLLILSCLLIPLTPTVESSNYSYYPSYRTYYPPAQVYNNNYYIQQPYAVPLYSAAYAPATAVISGSVSYQQAITTTVSQATATTVQTALGAEAGYVQADKMDRLISLYEQHLAILQQQSGASQKAYSQTADPPHVQILRSACASCHTGKDASGKFQVFDDAKKLTLKADDLGKIFYRLATNKVDPVTKKSLRMPRNGKLSAEDRDTLTEGLVTAQLPQAGKSEPEQQAQKVEPEMPPADPEKKEDGF